MTVVMMIFGYSYWKIRNGNCNKPRHWDALKLFGGQDAFAHHFTASNASDVCPRNSPAQHKKKRSIAGIAIGGNRNYSYPSSPVSVVESCVPSPKNRRLEWTLTGIYSRFIIFYDLFMIYSIIFIYYLIIFLLFILSYLFMIYSIIFI